VTPHTRLQQDEAKKVSGTFNHCSHTLVPGWHRGRGDLPVPSPKAQLTSRQPHYQNQPFRFANPSRSQAASMGSCPGVASRRHVGWTQLLRILFLGTKGVSCAAIHTGRVKNTPMGWYRWVSPGGIHCYRWRRRCGDAGEPSLEKLCKGGRRGPGWSLQRDITCPVPSISRHHPTSPLCPGLDTRRVATHRTKKSKNQTHGATGRNSRAPLRVFAPACSHQGQNLPAASWAPRKCSFNSTHNRKSNFSSPNIHPSLLGNGLGSFSPPPPLPGLHSSCCRDAQAASRG